MPWRPHGRATTYDSAWAICDSCGFLYAHRDLSWQYDYVGERLTNLRYLVCRTCYDTPQPQKKPVIVGPDPLPIQNPRPEYYSVDEEMKYYLVTEAGQLLVTENGNPLLVEQ